MSYTTKQRTRAKRIAIKRAKADHGEAMKVRHYLTLVKRSCTCSLCPARLRKGDDMIYRYEPREIVCRNCAKAAGISYRTSERWERLHRRKRMQDTTAPPKPPRRGYTPQALLADLVIEAACSAKCDPETQNRAWTRDQLDRWNVPWPPPKGWRRELVERWSDRQP